MSYATRPPALAQTWEGRHAITGSRREEKTRRSRAVAPFLVGCVLGLGALMAFLGGVEMMETTVTVVHEVAVQPALLQAAGYTVAAGAGR
jgi:hypothetical protein